MYHVNKNYRLTAICTNIDNVIFPQEVQITEVSKVRRFFNTQINSRFKP